MWIALAWEGHTHHTVASKWFIEAGEGEASFCRVTQMGFLRIITQAKAMGVDVLSHQEAWEVFDDLSTDGRVQFLGEVASPEHTWKTFSKSSTSNNIWTDSYLAAFATTHNLQLVTLDQGFSKYPGLNKTVLT